MKCSGLLEKRRRLDTSMRRICVMMSWAYDWVRGNGNLVLLVNVSFAFVFFLLVDARQHDEAVHQQ